MLPSIDGNARCAMVVPEIWSYGMCEDMEEEIREQLEANSDISDAVRGAVALASDLGQFDSYATSLMEFPSKNMPLQVLGLPLVPPW